MGQGMFKERHYRGLMKPPDLICYEVCHKETDLFCCTTTDLSRFIEDRVHYYRHQLEEYIHTKPLFKDSLFPVDQDPLAPALAAEMIRVSGLLGVGPMATVAGAMAEYVGRDIESRSEEFIIENGGDIFLKTKVERVVQVFANRSPFSNKIGIRLKADNAPYGVCTSSATVGPSLSFGKADAVCVVGVSSLFADGLATLLGNSVKEKNDISVAIEKGRKFPGTKGILIVLDEHLGVWGDIDLVRLE